MDALFQWRAALLILAALLVGATPGRAQNMDATGEASSDWAICMRLCYVAWAEANPPPPAKQRKKKTVSAGATYDASLFGLPVPTGDDGWSWDRFNHCMDKCGEVKR